MRRTLFCIISTVAISTMTRALAAESTQAAPDKYGITAAEKAACSFDAMRLCSGTFPDEDRLLACMKENRASLSRRCLVAFDAGVKRRHL